jgi:hypothetical protein
VRQGARILIGPLVGVALVAVALTGCGSSGGDIDSVVSPPTSEATATTAVASTMDVAESTTSTTVGVASTTTLAASAMTTQELAALEDELTQIDAILAELGQNFAAD